MRVSNVIIWYNIIMYWYILIIIIYIIFMIINDEYKNIKNNVEMSYRCFISIS